ncbi:flavin-containing monooxygenase FMO GS-OX-like 8 isoform X1 [Cryptomeria japonica]|uniref:flavin-containing monooxygenase FMO GS-OX-like 8 isoform X1 n=2 Tax=Cryptomeria japonica TaxID=3369 RepID=UPI0027DA013D|nr:flavin-containing monooxygenase FMO GS-OX-like 8 isoform X1 [Cryptomeria japonica]
MSSNGGFDEIKKVGVIGAGAAGLVAAKELQREGFEVVVYEQNADVGGIWLYNPDIEDDPLGLEIVGPNQGTIYESLRTNLTREVMGYMDYPFLVKEGRDPRRFPGHEEISLYLKDFARHFNLVELIRFNTKVEYVGMVGKCQEWVMNGERDCDMDGDPMDERVQWVVRATSSGTVEEEVFDAVVVCNGHYRQPAIAEIPGAQKWPGKQIHSYSYRVSEPFFNQVVVIIGSSLSACDISLDLKMVAKEVHLSMRSKYTKPGQHIFMGIDVHKLGVHVHPMITLLDENGTMVFEDGSSIVADSIIHCTGYSYSFPFLDTKGIVKVEDNCVRPLYEHIFPPLLAPSLSFVGIPKKVIPFPFFELQSKWIASILSRKVKLPSRREMSKNVKELYDYQEMIGISKSTSHTIGNFQYCDQLAAQSGATPFEEWRKEIAKAGIIDSISNPTTYRDLWDDHYLLGLLQKSP